MESIFDSITVIWKNIFFVLLVIILFFGTLIGLVFLNQQYGKEACQSLGYKEYYSTRTIFDFCEDYSGNFHYVVDNQSGLFTKSLREVTVGNAIIE